ncbi:MAG TPA: mechanosensitive ion channel family protein [Ktedonobacteraceae bacterium]|jgi:small-conductance mechanosensitive channel
MDFKRAWDTMTNMAESLIAALPNLVLAFLIFVFFYVIAKRIRLLVIQITEKQHRGKNLGVLLGKTAETSVVITGLLVTMTVVFPSFKPGDLIQLLGIGSVAIGFAFHDIFQNFLAGILLLLTAPFKIGDQIMVEGFEGTVEDIQTRATTIKTYDGRRVVLPNTTLFTNSVTVNTAFGKRRMEYEVGIDYKEDIDQVKKIILDAVNSIDGVLDDPPAEALVVALADCNVNIRIHWWTMTPQNIHTLHLQDKVLTALKNSMVKSGIDLPMPSQQILLQTLSESGNGNHSNDSKLLVDEKSSSHTNRS